MGLNANGKIEPSPDSAATTPVILVVDDEPANRFALQRLLRPLEAEVVEASSGNQALAAALRLDDSLALVLLDVQMPEMDGYEVAELLHGEESTRKVPIIFVTAAYRDAAHRLRGYEAGAVDYIEKPLEESILLSKVRVFLELWQQHRELQSVVEQLAEANLELQSRAARLRDAEQRLQYLSNHDALTQLPNRNLLENACQKACARAKRNRSHSALLFCDLDGFKPVNDDLGHEAGDQVLQELGLRLQDCLREVDTLARFGGDEFVVLVTDLNDAAESGDVAERLIAASTQPFDWKDRKIRIGMSIGIALYPEHGENQHSLVLAADQAMYRAKRLGGNRYSYADKVPSFGSEPADDSPSPVIDDNNRETP